MINLRDAVGRKEGAPVPSLPTVRAIAFGCWSCGSVIEAEAMRTLLREAWDRRFFCEGSDASEMTTEEWVTCPECDAPGTLVKVEVSMVPGMTEWNAGHSWHERGAR